MSFLSPVFEGRVRTRTPVASFLSKFRKRVESGLAGKPHTRWIYVITAHTDDELSFSASGFSTAINVGLNQVSLRRAGGDEIEYRVAFRTWAAFVVVLSGILGLVCAGVIFLMFRGSPAGPGMAAPPGGGRTSLAIGLGMASFWGFVWPWLLVAMHKGPVRKLLLRIIDDVDSVPA